MEDMKFYEEKDAYRVILRDPRQMHVKYMCMAKESFQLFSFQHTHINSGLAGLQNSSYNILSISSRDLIGKHGQVLEKYSNTFLKLVKTRKKNLYRLDNFKKSYLAVLLLSGEH